MFPQLFGKYVLERELASGGMARVHLATLRGADGFEKRLIVKQIRPELASDPAFVRRFVEEAKTTVELSHPNIVPVYELGVEQGVYYIAMEFCEGVTLSELLAETGPLSPEEGAYVGIEICRALDYAHRRARIVHRDVTPRNVIINDEGGVRLIDFGIAAPALGSAGGGASGGEVFGSPGHMPPEQLAGKALGPATDVFAVAVLLIEAWTGVPPFRRDTLEACEKALHEPRAALDERDERLAPLSELMLRATSLLPEERPESAELLARPLRQFLRNQDLGELERRLGLRVARARRRSQPRLATSALAQSSPDPTTPALATGASSSPELSTQTFAARDDLNVWTRKLPSIPPAATGSTDAGAKPLRASKAKTMRIDASEPTAAPPQEPAEPTPSEEPAALPGKPAAPPRPAQRMMTALGALLLLLVGVGGMRWASAGATARPPLLERSTLARAGPVFPPPTVGAPGIPPSAPRASSTAAAPRWQRTGSTTPVAAAEAGGAATEARPEGGAQSARAPFSCSVSLSSEPRAQVTIAGRVGETPFAVRDLSPGTYQVVFVAPALNEKLVGTVQLSPGDKKQLHADFTGATPRLH